MKPLPDDANVATPYMSLPEPCRSVALVWKWTRAKMQDGSISITCSKTPTTHVET
jgi:hypothetical protein